LTNRLSTDSLVTDPLTKVGLGLAVVCCAVLVALAIRPSLDLDAASLFYVGHNRFVAATRVGTIVRYMAWTAPFVFYAALLLAWIGARIGIVPAPWAPKGRSLLFATLSFAIGPGFLVHGTLKEISHRPRPYGVVQFGGQETFRPFYKFDGACLHNCSFPSGETATATWTLAPASLVPPPWRGAALGAALVFATATGTLRMAFGGHFLSDVCGAALITIAVVLVLGTALRNRLL
jgi:lipid A 4'-phosphatase